MRRSLRRAFRRVYWIGALPETAPDRPLLVYSNHHNFFDGYLMWLLADQVLGRFPLTWMRELEQYPFFKAAGAMTFPESDALARATTIRRTVALLREDPRHMLAYFPEGRIHNPEDGVESFDVRLLQILERQVPGLQFLPLAIHATWRGASQPVVLLTAGKTSGTVLANAADELNFLLQRLRTAPADEYQTLLEGNKNLDEKWSFGRRRG